MSVAVGAVNLVATMAALAVIDKIGRRKLMIVGSIGYLISLGFLAGVDVLLPVARDGKYTSTSAVLVLIGLMVFIAAHAFGQGSVIWVFISEIFPNRIRGRGQSLGQPDPLGVRRDHLVRVPADHRRIRRRSRRSASSSSA